MTPEITGLMVNAEAGLGILHRLTGVIAEHKGDILSVEILENSSHDARIYFEIALPSPVAELERDLRALPIVKSVEAVKSFQRIYGKRIIIIGGGAQVGQVAIGAISEADRHNIRGEHISVDTIPLVGEQIAGRRRPRCGASAAGESAGAGRIVDGRRDRAGRPRSAAVGPPGHQPEYGR